MLVIQIEDMGPQLGAYGTPGVSTPNMDRLAAEGARYETAYTTLPTCSASKAAMMTGYYNHATGAMGNVQEFVGSAEALAAENPGWLTDPTSPYNRLRIREEFPTLIERVHDLGMWTGLHNKFHLSPHDKFPYDRWSEDPSQGYEIVTEFLDEARSLGRPWFLFHVIADPHRPFPDGTTRALKVDQVAMVPPAYLPQEDETVRLDWAEYLQAIQDADKRVGDVLQALDDSGYAQDTLVVLIGDHGPSYHRAKYSTYDFGLRVPLLVRGPNVPPGSLRSELFSAVDLTPTVMAFLGRAIGSQGHSHASLLQGQVAASPNSHLVGMAVGDRSLFDGRYQLIYMPADNRDFDPWRNRVYRHIKANAVTPGYDFAYRLLDLADAALPQYARPRFELYDLQSDPWQTNDPCLSGCLPYPLPVVC